MTKAQAYINQCPAKAFFLCCNCVHDMLFIMFQLWKNITHHFHHNLNQPDFHNMGRKAIFIRDYMCKLVYPNVTLDIKT